MYFFNVAKPRAPLSGVAFSLPAGSSPATATCCRRRLSESGQTLGVPRRSPGAPARGRSVRAGRSVGNRCAIPSAGGGHGAPRRLPAPPRPRPPQRPLLAGAGSAPARSRLRHRPAVRPSPALRSALRRPTPASAPRGGGGGCEERRISTVLFRQAHGAALLVGVLALGLAGAHQHVETRRRSPHLRPSKPRRCPPNLPFKSPPRHARTCRGTSSSAAPRAVTTVCVDSAARRRMYSRVLRDVVPVSAFLVRKLLYLRSSAKWMYLLKSRDIHMQNRTY